MTLAITGKVWVFGNDLNTDAMYPAFAMKLDPPEAAKHVFYEVRPGWTDEVSPGDIVLAGKNFGLGSSRPVAALFTEGRQVRGIERARITFEIAPDRSGWGTEIAGKVKAWAKALTGPTSLPGKYPQLMNAPGSETGPGQLVTWGKSTICSVDAFGFKFQWTTNSSKHIPFDWAGP